MESFEARRKSAIKAANEELWLNHPNLNGRQLDLGPNDAPLRHEWIESYQRYLREYESISENDGAQETSGILDKIYISCKEAITDINKTKICLGYTIVIGSLHHAFVIAEHPITEEKFITRAGPSANGSSGSSTASSSSTSGGSISASSGEGSSGGFGFGTIRAHTGIWSEALVFDRPSDTVKQQCLGTIDVPYNQVVNRMREFARVTNDNEIPYFPLGPNSNSYAFTFVESLGISRPEPVVSAPGHSMGIPDDDLSYYP